MLILGLETSCDETGVALLQFDESGRHRVLAEAVGSQISLHEAYGGVVPELAAREHLTTLPILMEQVMSASGAKLEELSAIGCTVGPGLKGCLLSGLSFAQGLAHSGGVPLLGVNHIEGHIFSGELGGQITFPFLAVIVSGGHTEILSVRGLGSYELLFRTLDDAPGGPRLAALADTVTTSRFTLPKVSREIRDFSFSGLKTAVALMIERNRALIESDPIVKAEAAFAIQDAILGTLMHKLSLAVKESGISKIVISGGVSANKALRQRLASEYDANVTVPDLKYCMDNGTMIALVAGKRFIAKRELRNPCEVYSRWPVHQMA